MKIVDLTGDNRGVVGFHVDLDADGSFVGRLEVGKTTAEVTIGGIATNTPSTDEVQIKFDKPESVAVFIHQLQRGYGKLSLLAMQKQARDQALAEEQRKQAQANKKADLGARIERMARELSALQGEYADLPND